ncbi:MAG: LPP20 family lipoprotein [Pseudomonadota bacterium]
MIKKSFITVFLFFIFSCATSDQPQQLSSLPSWYITPKASDQNLYGVGEGYTLAEASQSALNNLASKLMTSISSESSTLLESNKYSTNEQSRQKINEVVAKITFNNYKVSNSAAFGGKIYTEISVNRDGFISDYSQKLQGLNQKMAETFKQAQNKSILEKLNDFQSVNDSSLEAESITQILASLGANQANFKSNIDLYNSYQNSYQNLVSKIEFFIENKNAPKALVAKLVTILNQKKLKVVKSKNLANSDLVIIQINADLTEQKIYGSYIAKLKVDFNLLSNQNKIIKSTALENSGSSVISREEAINAAVSGIADFNLF